MKKVFGAVMLVTGTIMGAGFCSGKEIVAYFAKFGLVALWFVPAMFLLYFLIFKVFLSLGAKENFATIEDINQKIFKKGNSFSNVLLFCVYLIFSSAMFAGIFEVGQLLSSNLLGYVLTGASFVFAFILLLKPFKYLRVINSALVPILIVLIILTCVKAFALFGFSSTKLIESSHSYLLFANPIVYACQGLVLAYFILIKTGEGMTRKQINLSALFSALILCVLQSLAIIVFNYNPELLRETMPFVSLSAKIGFPFDLIYLITLFVAILTTLLSTSRPLYEIVMIKTPNKKFAAFISLFLAVIFSVFGFDKIIEWFYPVIGIIGFVIFSLVVFRSAFVDIFKFTHKKIHKPSKKTQ